MAILMAYSMNNNLFRKITNTKSYRFSTDDNNTYYLENNHRLVRNSKYLIGGKTGYTKLARWTLVTVFSKNGIELIVVTFNCGNDFNVHSELSEYGFENLKKIKVFNPGVLDIPMYDYTPIIYNEISYPIFHDEELKCEIHLLRDPKDKEVIGNIILKINNQIVEKHDVYRYY